MSPPRANLEQQGIYELLQEGDSQELTFVYPKRGENRSAIIMKDWTGDGVSDAVGFVSTEGGGVRVSFLEKYQERWRTAASFVNAATQVDLVTFGDVNGDGLLEIPVASQLPAIPEDVSLDSTGFLVEWVNADTSGNYETALTALMNLGENYWFRLPASLVGKISASNNTAARSVTYTEVVTGEDGSQLLGSPLFTIRVFTRSAWDSRGETSGYEQLAAQGDLVFGIQTLTQDAEHLRAIAQIRSQFHVTLE